MASDLPLPTMIEVDSTEAAHMSRAGMRRRASIIDRQEKQKEEQRSQKLPVTKASEGIVALIRSGAASAPIDVEDLEETPLTEEEKNELKEAFDLFDRDCNGFIEIDEIEKVLRSLGHDVEPGSLNQMMETMDINRSGTIDFQEFLLVMSRLMREVDSEEDLVQIFRILDQDGDGNISKADLREVVVRVGSSLTNGDLEEMLDEADKDGDGQINFEEFLKIITARY